MRDLYIGGVVQYIYILYINIYYIIFNVYISYISIIHVVFPWPSGKRFVQFFADMHIIRYIKWVETWNPEEQVYHLWAYLITTGFRWLGFPPKKIAPKIQVFRNCRIQVRKLENSWGCSCLG